MDTWLIDTALLKTLATPKAAILRRWCDTHDASLFVSVASLTEIAAGVAKMPSSQSERAKAMCEWLDAFAARFADRIHPIGTEISLRAGAFLPSLVNGVPRHRLHDALLVATAEIHGHGLLTRREAIFGAWTKVPIATP